MERKFFSVAETAAYLGFHHSTIRRMIDRGELKASRIGRNLLIDLDALDAQLKAQAQQTEGAK